MHIASPTIVMLLVEWWSFEIIIVFAGFYDVVSQATCVLMLSITNFFYFLAIGMCITAINMIGTEIGRANVRGAKY